MSVAIAIEHPKFAQARQLLATGDSLRGLEYLNNPLKRRLDVSIAAAVSCGAVPIACLSYLAAFAWDRQSPFLSLPYLDLSTGARRNIYKVRTMKPGSAELEQQLIAQYGSMNNFKRLHRDPRVTPIGRTLRKLSFDEMPQIPSVLGGHLAMVGARPYREDEWNCSFEPNKDRQPYKDFIFLAENGLRYAVVSLYGIYGRAEMTFEERVTYDCLYGREANFWGDIRMVGATFMPVLTGNGAK
ncbi:hypothetical protein A2631_01315 [Candidatus Daviesbacteria bacterium RIFCSPHIGHO2_01_FULL_44_29]|uniref:Bacterial sugar transferase domain-containing protein n=1 Tax=Candidatus Daviesbacteria bacterium RIFCSPHIGHO2_02_FULL_43_12 TaxID=1797776 RepID=A0A1F5KLP5_9BACT|nr:MAG: hypothetical protein A2631_01315 [Candidatus Daviesbacteria bacterium RIFCSPHIGHO2_01_FULL_44_29]OGE39673.1 MAG: hypothetical protein A3E86_00015 [Candidatus Daviesbacteria bacterium RIFCSPHIGHO2_12_FULL_47_45]OGE41531.1 MAG: hypothetical protein A3D25_00735 [Candidatus Daviesbacteria bacterium RIFCSPHIGHO2_02_FULL_43_12]OGE69813.1 MAG: hypothetical protein A3B55_05380 [Candidatus Daviesbacteria bacterium RIFCSPLOWO2_01_FULL_43_15]